MVSGRARAVVGCADMIGTNDHGPRRTSTVAQLLDRGTRNVPVQAAYEPERPGRGPEPPRSVAPLDHPGGRGLAAPAADRLDRPLPTAPPRPEHTGGWLSGRWRKATGQQSSSRAGRLPERFDLSQPGNQRKLDAVEELARLAEQSGITLIQLAIGFVLTHPAITSAIIGPRTMEQFESQVAAADVVLDAAVLDRIDAIVPPGVTVNPVDSSFDNPALEPAARRR
jgi:aldo/keto reductase family protein